MILPNKYVPLTESYIVISALILEAIGKKTLTVDVIWNIFRKKYVDTKRMNSNPTYQKFIQVLEFMYMTNMINYTLKGEVFNENIKS